MVSDFLRFLGLWQLARMVLLCNLRLRLFACSAAYGSDFRRLASGGARRMKTYIAELFAWHKLRLPYANANADDISLYLLGSFNRQVILYINLWAMRYSIVSSKGLLPLSDEVDGIII